MMINPSSRVLARDQSASLEDWQKLARTGEIVWFYNGRDRKKTGKSVRNGHFGRAVSESWLNPCQAVCALNKYVPLQYTLMFVKLGSIKNLQIYQQ